MRHDALLIGLFSVTAGCARDDGGGGTVETYTFDADAGATVVLSPSDGGTVTSLDGRLTLVAPGGAVAEDTTITVHTLTLQDDPSVVVYELLPHGLTFDVPVSVHRANDAPSLDGSSPPTMFGVMSVDGELELPASTQTEPESESGSLDAALSHFSYIHTGHANVLEVEATVEPADDGTIDANAMPPQVCEGATFDVTTTVSLVRPTSERGFPSVDLLEDLPAAVSTDKGFFLEVFEVGVRETNLAAGGVVTIRSGTGRPQDRYIRSDEQALEQFGEVTLTHTFFCDDTGTGEISIAHFGPGSGHLDGWVDAYSWEDTPAGRRLAREISDTGEIDTDVDFNQAYGEVRLTIECVPCDGNPITTCEGDPVATDAAQRILDDGGLPLDAEDGLVCADPQPTNHGLQSDPGARNHVHIHGGASWARQFSDLARSPIDEQLTTGGLAQLDCGSIPDGLVVCADPATSLSDTEVHVLAAMMYGDIPLGDPDNPYQYGFVFDADDEPSNNYFPPPYYPFDTYQNTDRWYQLWWEPAQGWRLEVIDATRGQLAPLASRARVVILGNALVLLVPADEMPSDDPLHRFTAYRGELVPEPVDFNIDAEPPVTVGLRAFDGTNVVDPPRACIMNQTVTMGGSSEPIPGDMRRFAAICPADVITGVGDCPELQPGTCFGAPAEVTFERDGDVYSVRVHADWTIVDASHGTEDPGNPERSRTDLPQDTDITLDVATPDGDTTVVFQLVGDTAFVAEYDPTYPYD